MANWFNQLNALPTNPDSSAYRRLKRIWNDKTRYHGKENTNERIHEFFDQKHETNLTVTLWENFVMFDPDIWIKALLDISNIRIPIDKIIKCNWSYEWEKRMEKGIRLCDIVIKFIDNNNVEYLLVVECKNLKIPISSKDTQPEYYLNIEDFDRFGTNKFLIYCIDELVRPTVTLQIQPSKFKTGIVTWQELATLQLEAVQSLNLNEGLKGFIIGSIYNQFQLKSIMPLKSPFNYLTISNSQSNPIENTVSVQTSIEREFKYWDE